MELPENVGVGRPGSAGAGLCGTLSRAIWGPGPFGLLASSSLRVVTCAHADRICVPGRRKAGWAVPAEIALRTDFPGSTTQQLLLRPHRPGVGDVAPLGPVLGG